jgi:indolepyruvate ferredoxin oxidoreductase
MSGVQALVKLPMLQRQRDAVAGKNTAGFISGYRGSPLGGYDQALVKAAKYLKAQNIVFQPGVNEGFQQIVEGGNETTAFVGGEKQEEEEDKSQKELGSCKG